MFDGAKMHVYNEALGGRSSRSYIEEGLWSNVLARMEPGDFVIVMFGHNDSANSKDHPDRTTITGNGEWTISVGLGDTRKMLHTYGWYLRQYAKDGKARGATVILCSPVPRNDWVDGKIKRGFDGYAGWAADAAKESGALFLDLNNLASDCSDALGKDEAAKYFADHQHTTKAGARLNAEAVAAGLRQLKDCPLAGSLGPE
jgi:lysophospholipase L1-like esterase